MANKANSTCENNLGLSLSITNSDKVQAQQQLIPQVLDPLTPHSSGWDHQNHGTFAYTIFLSFNDMKLMYGLSFANALNTGL